MISDEMITRMLTNQLEHNGWSQNKKSGLEYRYTKGTRRIEIINGFVNLYESGILIKTISFKDNEPLYRYFVEA